MKPTPIVITMVMCDHVLQDVRTNKKSLIGLFNQFNVGKFPSKIRTFSVFVKLTEGRGAPNCELRCINAETNDLIAQLTGPINFKNPNDILDFTFQIDGLSFPAPGDYRFEFLSEGKLLSSNRFKVIQNNRGAQ